MAGASSEAGYLNIGTAETSSHPEIEPEIEAVEATGDSDEVCSLERKECDEIMEHLKNNPGLVVKSLGPEGRIVLHVAVVAGETKKPKPPASKCTNVGLSEAADGSDWYHALRWQDCKALMSLLQANPCLVAQTGPEGWTVLHAATQRGCLSLLDQVFDLFEDNRQFVDEMSGVKVAWVDLLSAKCGTFEAEARDLARFTCSEREWRFLCWGTRDTERFSSPRRPMPDASQHLRDKIIEIMQGEPSRQASEMLEIYYKSDENYNFVLERKELQFHYACERMWIHTAAESFVRTVIDGCLELGPSESVQVLTYLFQLHNAQGQTPVHLAAAGDGRYIAELLGLVPPGDAYKECLNAEDVRGWTALHYAAATRCHGALEALLKDERTDVNARTSYDNRKVFPFLIPKSKEAGMTALHLAILHDDVTSVELLLRCPRTDVNALFRRHIVCGYEKIRPGDDLDIRESRSYWSPLQLAAIMGLSDVVRVLLALKIFMLEAQELFQQLKLEVIEARMYPKSKVACGVVKAMSLFIKILDKMQIRMGPKHDWTKFELCDIYDDGKLQNNSVVEKPFRNVSALLLASASRNPDTLRLFLDNRMFNPLVKFEGATALHYATNAMIPGAENFSSFKVGHILLFSDLGYLNLNTCRYKEEFGDIKLSPTSYLGRQACITMLLQAGVDIWDKDKRNRLAEPGPQAPEEAHLWWHEKMARETLEAKQSLNGTANAISVVAALVATASFVGPLQPPLGYREDSMEGGVQDTHLSVQVFMVSNILSFYLAVASIMFAVVPSLPMPQEGIYLEWQRTRRTVGVAIFFLLMSVLGVLISFGAASNSVVSDHYSWRHVGLSFYPTLVGGFICILGISLFFLKLMRLVFNRNAKIRSLYKAFVKF